MKKRVISLLLCLLMALSLIPTAAFAEIQRNNTSTMTFKIVNGTWNLPQGTNATLSSDKKEVTFTTYWSTEVQAYVYECSQNNSNSLEAFLNAILGSGGNPATYIAPDDGYTLNGMTNQDWAVNAGGMKANGSLSANGQMKLIWRNSHSYDTHGNDETDGFYAGTVYTLTLTKSSYTVEYDLNGGETTSTTTKFTGLTYNQTTPTIDNPTKRGYTFAGWKPSVAEKVIADAVYVAQWTEIETVDIPVTKVWDDDNNFFKIRPDSVTVQLMADGKASGNPVTLDETNSWAYTFTNLDKTNSNGVDIVYTVVETAVPGYKTSYTDTKIINTLDFETEDTVLGNLTIRKVDKEKQNVGLSGAVFTLTKDNDSTFEPITITTGEGATASFTGLDVGTYTLTETAAPEGYKLGTTRSWTVTVAAGTPYAKANTDADGNITGYKKVTPCTVTVTGLTAGTDDIYPITNEAIEKTSITVTKVWDDMLDEFGLRPESIQVQLKANDKNYGDPVEITPDAEGNWTYTFTDLNKTDSNGDPIAYTVEEVNTSKDYTSTVEQDNGNFTIINTLKTGHLVIHKFLWDKNGDPADKTLTTDKDLTFHFDVYAKGETTPILEDLQIFVMANTFGTEVHIDMPLGEYYVVERGVTDKTVEAPSNYQYVETVIEYDDPKAHEEVEVNALTADPEEPAVAPTSAVVVADKDTFAYVDNYYAHDPYTVTIPVTKTVTKGLNSLDPGKTIFTFKAQILVAEDKWVDLECTNNKIEFTGTGTKNIDMNVVIPAEYFTNNAATLRIIEVNDGLNSWTYDSSKHEVKAMLKDDGTIMLEYTGKVAFTNTYSYTYTPPRPNPKPNPKPVTSVKTGDMGIALYAMTSLLSLGGTALVIKKRKDEE